MIPRLLPCRGGAVGVAHPLERDGQAERVELTAAIYPDELASPPGGHHLGAAELDENPRDLVLGRLSPPAGLWPSAASTLVGEKKPHT